MYGADANIDGELLKGERVLWSAQPNLTAVFCRGDLFLVPASLLWSAMALSFAVPMLWAAVNGAEAALPFVVFFAAPFTGMAFYAMIGRLVFRMLVKSRTHYFVTDERVLAMTRLMGSTVHASFLDEITGVTSMPSTRGAETIWFGEPPWWKKLLGACALDSPIPFAWNTGPVAFYDIRDADQVRQLVRAANSPT